MGGRRGPVGLGFPVLQTYTRGVCVCVLTVVEKQVSALCEDMLRRRTGRRRTRKMWVRWDGATGVARGSIGGRTAG